MAENQLLNTVFVKHFHLSSDKCSCIFLGVTQVVVEQNMMQPTYLTVLF